MTDKKPCKFCGKDLLPGAKHPTRKDYCNIECHDAWHSQNRKFGAQMMELFPCLCEECRAKVTKSVNHDAKRPQSAAEVTPPDTAVEETGSGT